MRLDKIKDGVYYPAGIRKLSEGGKMIQEGVDNIDINTNTIDGKDTFHSFARVCFQLTGDSVYASEDLNIPKRKEYALKLTPEVEKTMKPMPFSKPKVRPVPPRYNIATERTKSIMKDNSMSRISSGLF